MLSIVRFLLIVGGAVMFSSACSARYEESSETYNEKMGECKIIDKKLHINGDRFLLPSDKISVHFYHSFGYQDVNLLAVRYGLDNVEYFYNYPIQKNVDAIFFADKYDHYSRLLGPRMIFNHIKAAYKADFFYSMIASCTNELCHYHVVSDGKKNVLLLYYIPDQLDQCLLAVREK